MPFRLLLTGDLHIGRSSSRLPDSLRNEARAVSAWLRMIDLALAEKVDAVVLSGDVVDEHNRFWEAIGPLESGVNRLAEAAIPVLAVAGNHDYQVLARLADQLPRERFALLGRGGTWERFPLMRDGRPWLYVDGWSFSQASVRTSPLSSYAFPAALDAPILGLVHGDLGAVNTAYAPLDLGRLQALPPQAWLLGHIHAPRLHAATGQSWVLMPGSLQALDPGETGPHGPWIAEVTGTAVNQPVQRPLSAAWYDEATLDVSSAPDEPALETLILDFLRTRAGEVVQQAGEALAHVSLRLRLVGASPIADKISTAAERLRQGLELPVGRGTLVIDNLEFDLVPALNLAEHARTSTALGAVARLLLDLDNPQVAKETEQLLQNVRQSLTSTGNAKEFIALDHPPLPDERVREVLRNQANALLIQLARQAI